MRFSVCMETQSTNMSLPFSYPDVERIRLTNGNDTLVIMIMIHDT